MTIRSHFGGSIGAWWPYADAACDVACHRYYLVYKLGLALVAYHSLQALALVGVQDTQDPRAPIQEGFWPVKILLLFSMAVGSYFLPRWLMDYMFMPTLVMGVLFLVLQAVLLIDLAYSWAETLLEGAEQGSGLCRVLLVVNTLLLNSSAAGVVVAIYWYFDRELERSLVTINALLIIAMTVCSVLPVVQQANPSSGIFQSSLTGLYSLLVLVGAFINDPSRPKGPDALMITYPILGKLVSVFSVLYAYLAVAHSAVSLEGNLHRLIPESENGLSDPDERAGEYDYSLFHVNFVLAAFYTMLYVTFWQYSFVDTARNAVVIIDSLFSFWSRVVSSWLVAAIYVWSLFAPIYLEDRF